MAKPWEKYQKAPSDGPWAKYQGTEAERLGRSAPEVGELETAIQGFGQGVGFGYLPEMQAAASVPLKWLYEKATGNDVPDDTFDERLADFRARDIAMQEQRPGMYMAGQLGGALASAPMMPGLAAAKGAGLAARLGRAGLVGAGTGFLYNPHMGEQGSDMSFELGDRVGNAAIGGMLGVGTQGAVETVKGGLGLVPKLSNLLDEGKVVPLPVENADEVARAAKIIGTKPTAGMLTSSPVLQSLESSLEQSPSFAGAAVRKQTGAVRNATKKAAEELLEDASSLTPYEAGSRVQSDILGKFDKQLKPLQKSFDDLRSYTKDMEILPKGLNIKDARTPIAKAIMNMDEVRLFPQETWSRKAKVISENIMRAKTTKDITEIRKVVGGLFQEAQPGSNDRRVFGQIYDKLGRLEERTILRSAVQSAPTPAQGEKIGSQIVKQMRGAKKGYREMANQMRDFGDFAEFKGTKSPTQFFNSLKKVKPEDFLKKLSNTDDVTLMRKLKEGYPDQFEVIRQKKLGEFVERSKGRQDQIDIGKFMSATKSLSREAKELLFGTPEGVEKFEALKTLWRSAPSKTGASDTSRGMSYLDMAKIPFQLNEAARKVIYDLMSSPSGQQKINKAISRVQGVQKVTEPVRKGLLKASKKPGLLPSVIERSRR
jgi:hypothetical protein